MRNIQASGMLYGKHVTVNQISKAAARKLFAAGEEIGLQSCNMHPFGPWQGLCVVKLDTDALDSDIKTNQYSINLYTEQVVKFKKSNEEWSNNLIPEYESKVKECNAKVINAGTQFDSVCNNYSYYNCDSERGNYITYYKIIQQ